MFQDFAPFFGPEDLDSMSAAFDAVWYQLCFWGLVGLANFKSRLPGRNSLKLFWLPPAQEIAAESV
jgi:hypothetical protein